MKRKMKRNTKKRMRISTGDRIYLCVVYLFLLVFTGCILYPLLYVVSCSFSSPEALIQGRVFFLPVEPGLQGYTAVFNNNRVWSGYGNTILYTVTGTVVATAVTMIASFVLSRREFPLRESLSSMERLSEALADMPSLYFQWAAMPYSAV